jgi:sugar phosphate isomerase/epimerase
MKNKKFITIILGLSFAIFSIITLSCSDIKNKSNNKVEVKPLFFKLSIAQWSIHRMVKENSYDPYEFASLAKELGFEGLEYVNALYDDVMKSDDKKNAIEIFIEKSKALADENKINNVLIMIDGEGDLASSDPIKQKEAIENHKLWIYAASKIGCSSVRLNLYGEKDPDKWISNSINSLSELSKYAKTLNINVLVENHGRITSNIPLLMKVIYGVNMDNCGTLPDFGNFCMSDEGYGSIFDGSCKEAYDIYKGISEMMPKAFGVSAKSYDFNSEGFETTIDYKRMLEIVKNQNYKGFIGVEYEGKRLSELEGIKATKDLLIKIGGEM